MVTNNGSISNYLWCQDLFDLCLRDFAFFVFSFFCLPLLDFLSFLVLFLRFERLECLLRFAFGWSDSNPELQELELVASLSELDEPSGDLKNKEVIPIKVRT